VGRYGICGVNRRRYGGGAAGRSAGRWDSDRVDITTFALVVRIEWPDRVAYGFVEAGCVFNRQVIYR